MAIQEYVSEARRLNELEFEIYFGFPVDEKEKGEFEACYDKLVEVAKQHIEQHIRSRPQRSKGYINIWAVHPSSEEIDNGKRPKQIRKLLNSVRKDRNECRSILVSDAVDYIINDYRFLKEGLFDGVVLTEYNEGKPLALSDLDPFKDAELNLIGGCYVGMCLDTFAEVLREAFPDTKIKIIKKWSYDPRKLTLEEKFYRIIYSLAPSLLRNKLPEPRILPEEIFVPRGTFG
ncbi:MAG: hypothetical protein DRP03_02685 [Candidatus Aenigmatarchaeota archaeon]|nr:MAG: hypothetical protein DRP03_02685 [Candidatus Aenigmarchaeota archaeon]